MNRLNSISNRAKRFQVRIMYHEQVNGSYEEIKTITTGEYYKLVTEFNSSSKIASITIVKVKR